MISFWVKSFAKSWWKHCFKLSLKVLLILFGIWIINIMVMPNVVNISQLVSYWVCYGLYLSALVIKIIWVVCMFVFCVKFVKGDYFEWSEDKKRK